MLLCIVSHAITLPLFLCTNTAYQKDNYNSYSNLTVAWFDCDKRMHLTKERRMLQESFFPREKVFEYVGCVSKLCRGRMFQHFSSLFIYSPFFSFLCWAHKNIQCCLCTFNRYSFKGSFLLTETRENINDLTLTVH